VKERQRVRHRRRKRERGIDRKGLNRGESRVDREKKRQWDRHQKRTGKGE
jgi:hypothetical protein